MKIQVLGSSCPTCKSLHKAVVNVAEKLDSNLEVEYSDDITEIVKLGAMSNPVFVIDGEVVVSGRVPSDGEIEKAISERF